MQLGVHGHSHESRPPGGVERLEILGAILHEDRDAVTRGELRPPAQAAREARGALRELAIARPGALAMEDGDAAGIGAGGAVEPGGEVHREA